MNDGEDLVMQLRTASIPARPHAPAISGSSAASRGEASGNHGRRVIRSGHEEWPEALHDLSPHDPPERLYVEGRPLKLDVRTVAVVGTRRPTAAGVEAAEQLTRGLVEAGFTIVSGLAMGIDTIAHRTALRAGGLTVAVLGCGLDVDYPLRNRALKSQIAREGTLVTEYPEGTQPHAHHFPLRNRIVAGVAKGVLVIEGGLRSGALITARIGVDANRSVWALPGSVRNAMAQGPNELIRTGQAGLVTHVEHMFADIAPALVWDGDREKPPLSLESLSTEERSILMVLDDVAVAPDRVVRLTGLAPGSVALSLSRLEVRGFVNRRRGGYEISTSGGRIRALLGDDPVEEEG